MSKIKKAFTLIEMLVVISIIALMALGISQIQFTNPTQEVYAAQRSMMAAFYEARMAAITKQTDARVIIYKGHDEGRRLRQVGVIYKVFNEEGAEMGWVALNQGFVMTKNAFFIPSSSEFAAYVKMARGRQDTEVFKSTFNSGATGSFHIVGLSEFPSTEPQTLGEGNGDWFSYHFSSDGLSMNPGAMVMIGQGSIDSEGIFEILDPEKQMGFVVRRLGNTVAFTDYDEMEEVLK